MRSLRKNKNNNFIILIRSISRQGGLVKFQLKNTLVNDGDKKIMANKFYQKYLRQDKSNLIRSLYVKSQFIASTSNTTFWWALQAQTKWVIFEPARTHHLSLKVQNFENLIFTFECFSLNAVYNSCKLQRLLHVAKFCLCTPLLILT